MGLPKETAMIAKWVKVTVKPKHLERFLRAIEFDALGSEANEEGCLRFNVLRDLTKKDVYYFYEVYAGHEAVKQHERTAHFAAWLAARKEALAGDPEIVDCAPVFPSSRAYWRKPGA